jgi:hypothetical protein
MASSPAQREAVTFHATLQAVCGVAEHSRYRYRVVPAL